MARLPQPLSAAVATVATAALVLAGIAPAYAARATSFEDARHDVRDYTTDEPVDGRRASIDIRKGRAVTVRKFHDSLRVTVRIDRVRRRQPQAVYVGVEQGTESFQVFAPLDSNRVRVDPGGEQDFDRCGRSRTEVDRRRDRATVTVAKRCLGGGRSMDLAEVATFYAESPASEDLQAFDRVESVFQRTELLTLRYPRKRR